MTRHITSRAMPAIQMQARYSASSRRTTACFMAVPSKKSRLLGCRRPGVAESFLLDVVDALHQSGELRAVLRPHRRRGVVERLGVRVDELDAGGLELLRVLGHALVPQAALLHLRLAREL